MLVFNYRGFQWLSNDRNRTQFDFAEQIYATKHLVTNLEKYNVRIRGLKQEPQICNCNVIDPNDYWSLHVTGTIVNQVFKFDGNNTLIHEILWLSKVLKSLICITASNTPRLGKHFRCKLVSPTWPGFTKVSYTCIQFIPIRIVYFVWIRVGDESLYRLGASSLWRIPPFHVCQSFPLRTVAQSRIHSTMDTCTPFTNCVGIRVQGNREL